METTVLHGQHGSRATGPELRWPQAEWEAHAGDSLSARRKRLGSSHDSIRHAHNRVASQQCTCLDTQAPVVLMQGAQVAVPAACLPQAEVAGGQGEALARRLRWLGSQIREEVASVKPCIEGEQWCCLAPWYLVVLGC